MISLRQKLCILQKIWLRKPSLVVSLLEQCNHGDTLAKERWARRSMGRGQKYSQNQRRPGRTQSNILLTFGRVVSSCAIICLTKGKRVCRGFQNLNAHAEHERFDRSRIGNCTSIKTPPPPPSTKSISAYWEVQMNEGATVYVKDLDFFIVTVQLLEDTPPILSLGQLCADRWYSFQVRHHILQNDRKYHAIRKTTCQ